MRFAVQPPWKPWASPRSHGLPRRDVPGCVHISVEHVTAGHAGEESLALAALRCDVPARRAALTRKRSLNPLHPARSFIFQSADQQTPAGPQNLAVQAGLLGDLPAWSLGGSLSRTRHIADFQILNPDYVETSCQIRAGLLGPVLARVRFACFQSGDGQLHADAAARAAFGPRQLTLKTAEPALARGPKPRRSEQFSRRQDSRDSYTTSWPPPGLLLDCQVPHEPGLGAVVPKDDFLVRRRVQAVPGHANTLANASVILGEVKRRCIPRLEAEVSTPRPR